MAGRPLCCKLQQVRAIVALRASNLMTLIPRQRPNAWADEWQPEAQLKTRIQVGPASGQFDGVRISSLYLAEGDRFGWLPERAGHWQASAMRINQGLII